MIMIKRKLSRRKLTELEQFIFDQALLRIRVKEDINKEIKELKGTVLGLNKYAIENFKKLTLRKVEHYKYQSS